MFAADFMKQSGFHQQSRRIYERATHDDALAYDALCALADLLLARRRWALEFAAYSSRHLVNDPWRFGERPQGDWRDDDPQEAEALLKRACALAPDDDRAPWLLAMLFALEGRKDEAVAQLDVLERVRRQDAESDLGHLKMKLLFPHDAEAAVSLGNKQLKGWRDERGSEWRVSALKCGTSEEIGATSPPRIDRVIGPTELRLETGFAVGGVFKSYATELSFPPANVTLCDNAILLPLYGTAIAEGKYLLLDTFHMDRVHVEVFTPFVRTVNGENALVCMPEPLISELQKTVFIGNNANYFHWLLEDLPRLLVLEGAGALKDRRLLLDESTKPWQLDLLSRLGIEREQLVFDNFTHPLACRDIALPSRLSSRGVCHPHAVHFLRDRLLPSGGPITAKPGKRLFLTRKSVPGRSMINADEVTHHFRRAGFVFVDPSALSIDEQIDLFADAEVIAGPAGAALTNLLFAPADARLIQLGSTDSCGETFTSLAACIGQRSCGCFGRGYPRTFFRWIWTNYDFHIDTKDLDLCFEQML
ncbi:MAG: DUF563 domain-containing protein [Mycobacterium sp.]|uniref:glycosyltransferase 61 family protein n=1 Tax=Mycobacterium sp. TaxID=1785 RepID=UPI001ED0B8C9|nr:glycosyltransferase 61 family protein [Mycobacterium sp.]MBV8786785.1 DUF563 domain-containing protein [Mycobacterium sp.]MBV9997042.1 DUF563 domain-containing protein [Caulobacteraceae bacterium]